MFLLILPLLMGTYATAQTKDNVARECVLFEIFTGVRCPYCPAAANGIAQLLEEGKAIAPVAYHTSAFSNPEYYTNETEARASYYGVTGYPTLKTDGLLSHSGGGGASESNYSAYLSRYNQRINQTSPFTIDLSMEPAENGLCRVNCTVNQVGECDATNVRVFIALTQCNIDVMWQGMQGLHHVCRDMIPTQTGTVFTGPSMTISETFELNYPKEDCYLTAWVQNYNSNKEVYQAVRMSTAMELDYDLGLKGIDVVATQNCSGLQHPVFTVKNFGRETITSFEMCATDGTEEFRQTWNGSLPQGETIEVQMDDFYAANTEKLDFSVAMPNGHDDGFMADNFGHAALTAAPEMDGYMKIQLKSGRTPESESIVITDMTTGEVFETFTFEQPSHAYTFEVILPNASCYRIAALDAEGKGWDGGFFQIKGSDNQVLFKGGGAQGTFTTELAGEVYCNGFLNGGEIESQGIDIYPNPSKGIFTIDLGEGSWSVNVFDMTGRCVMQSQIESQGEIDMSAFEKGVYFVRALNGTREFTEKVVVL